MVRRSAKGLGLTGSVSQIVDDFRHVDRGHDVVGVRWPVGDDWRSLDVVSTTAQFDPRAVRRDWAILDGVFLVAAVNDERHPRAHGRELLTALCLPWLSSGGAGVRTEALVGQAAVSNDWSRGIPALNKLGVA
jgi:hypothetical protein